MGIASMVSNRLTQTAVYWAPTSQRNGDGTKQYVAGVEIKCLWLGTEKILPIGGTGKEIKADALVYVNIDIADEGMLYFGNLIDLDSNNYDDPANIDKAYEVITFKKTPALNLPSTFVRAGYIRKRTLNN